MAICAICNAVLPLVGRETGHVDGELIEYCSVLCRNSVVETSLLTDGRLKIDTTAVDQQSQRHLKISGASLSQQEIEATDKIALATTDYVPGRKTECSLGIVDSTSVYNLNSAGSTQGARAKVVSQDVALSKRIKTMKAEVILMMKLKAQALCSDAVVGVRFEITGVGTSKLSVSVSGTAVLTSSD